MLSAALGACGAADTQRALARPQFGVGVHTENLVDPSRDTPANGTVPAHTGRDLTVTLLYPSAAKPGGRPTLDASPDRSRAPYPVVVFAHGFGSSPAQYETLLADWASSGLVVAAPTFPLTNSAAPGGPDLADYVNQPGDMSFVITQVLAQSAHGSGLLAGLVDPGAIGVAGHSLGGVTTLGLVANTCCTDPRIRAAVVMSGDPISFPGGDVHYGDVPILFVHGSGDQTVPYASSVMAFDAAQAPKGLLTIVGGGHGSPVDPAGSAFPSVVSTTSDFFARYLKGQTSAAGRLPRDASPGTTTLALALGPHSHVHLPVPPSTTGKLHAVVSPDRGLTDGQHVVVSWRGYRPGVTVNILECSMPVTGPQACNLSTATVGQPDPVGAGSASFVVHTGPVGASTCDAAHSCEVVVNQGGASSPADSVLVPVTFAG